MRNIVVTLALALASSAFADKAVTSTEILTHEQVKATVDTHIGDVKGCMKSAGGPAKGKLVIRFGVLPSGHTLDPAVREPTVNGALDKCVAAAARAWVFPTRGASAPTQGVDYPFVFSAPVQTAVAQGTLKREDIVKTIATIMPKVGDCLDEARLKKSDVVGVVTTEIHVGADGKVASIKQLSSTTNYAPLDACIVKQAQTLQFPKPDGNAGVVIEYPFVLQALPAPKK